MQNICGYTKNGIGSNIKILKCWQNICRYTESKYFITIFAKYLRIYKGWYWLKYQNIEILVDIQNQNIIDKHLQNICGYTKDGIGSNIGG